MQCFLVFNYEFYFFQKYCTYKSCPFICNWDNPLANVPQAVSNSIANFSQGDTGYQQPFGKFIIECQRFLATLCQIPQRAFAIFANSAYFPEGCQYPLILGQSVLTILQRVVRGYWKTSIDICINEERGNLSAISLKKLSVKIKIQEATDTFESYSIRGSSSNLALSTYTLVAHLNLVRQSR